MTTKLEIIGPYTPDHEGPFCTRDGRSVRIICTNCFDDRPIIGLVIKGASESTISYYKDGSYLPGGIGSDTDLMNAREVPVAREFWVIGGRTYTTPKEAIRYQEELFVRYSSKMCIIHVREVLPGDDQ